MNCEIKFLITIIKHFLYCTFLDFDIDKVYVVFLIFSYIFLYFLIFSYPRQIIFTYNNNESLLDSQYILL